MLKIYIGTDPQTNVQNVLNQCVENQKNLEKTLLITAENKMYFYENLICKNQNDINIFVDIVSFSRLWYLIVQQKSKKEYVIEDEISQKIHLKNIIKRLNLPVISTDKLVDDVIILMNKVYQNNLTYDKFEEILDKTKGTLLSKKIEDLYKIVMEYEKVRENTIVQNQTLQIISDTLKEQVENEQETFFKDKHIILINFDSLNDLYFDILASAVKQAKDVSVYIPIDKVETKNDNFVFNQNIFNKVNMIFSNFAIENNLKKTDFKIINLQKEKEKQEEQEKENNINNNINTKNNNLSKLQKELENTSIYELYKYENISYEKDSEKENDNSLVLFKAKNPKEELLYVAKDIYKKIQNGVKPSDIQVLKNDILQNENDIMQIFANYNIPISMNRKMSVKNTSVVAYFLGIFSLLRLDIIGIITFLKRFTFKENFKSLWKMPEDLQEEDFIPTYIDVCNFEKYYATVNFYQSNLFKPFEFLENTKMYKGAEKTRKYIIYMLTDCINSILLKDTKNEQLPENITYSQYTKIYNKTMCDSKVVAYNFYEYLERNEVYNIFYREILEQIVNYNIYLDNYLATVLKLNKTIDRLSLIGEVPFKEFFEYFDIALKDITIAEKNILNSVVITNSDNATLKDYTYILSANDLNYPQIQNANLLITKSEVEYLAENDFTITMSSKMAEEFALYKSIYPILATKKQLHFSYNNQASDEENQAVPSFILNNISEFLNLPIKNIDNKSKESIEQLVAKVEKEIADFEKYITSLNNLDDLQLQEKNSIELIYIDKIAKSLNDLIEYFLQDLQSQDLLGYEDKKTKEAIEYQIYALLAKIENLISQKLAKNNVYYDDFGKVRQHLSDLVVSKVYDNKLNTTVSRLEKYSRCPFAYHLEYVLKVDPGVKFEIQANQSGTLMHEIIRMVINEISFGNNTDTNNSTSSEKMNEYFAKLPTCDIWTLKYNKNAKEKFAPYDENDVENYIAYIKDLTYEKYNDLIAKEEFKVMLKDSKNTFQTNKIIENTFLALINIIETIRLSNYKVLGNEIDINIDEFANQENLSLYGKIDRADYIPEQKSLRIIDYKSSKNTLDMAKIAAGLQLQLFTYANILSKKQNLDIKSLSYFTLNTTNKKIDKTNIQADILKYYKNLLKFEGLNVFDTLEDLEYFDNTVNYEKEFNANISDVKISKGKMSSRNSLITSEQYEKLQDICTENIKNISSSIKKGDVDIHPFAIIKNGKVDQKACTYCQYKSICKIQSKSNYKIINQDKDILL